MERCVTSAVHHTEIDVVQFGDNRTLSTLLHDLGYPANHHVHGTATERRSEIRRALSDTDHLLMMWDGRSLTQLLFEARLRAFPTKLFAIEVATVVNKDRGDDFDVYIGRGTPWGNPYPVGKQEGQYERD